MRVSRRGAWLAVAMAILASACSSSQPAGPTSAGPPASSPPVRVLMLTATAGFRHDAIATASQAMASLAASSRAFTVTTTEQLSMVTAASLAEYDVLFFALTSGELPLTAEQKAAVLAFVAEGRGFMGAHSATDTLYGWPEYERLVGSYFKEHPWTQQGTVIVEDPSHPGSAGLGDRFALVEEFYTFRENPRPRVRVLLRLDAASVGATGDFPLAWAGSYGGGRTYYNALGHFPATWTDARFQRQLLGAIQWVAGR